MPSSRAAHPTAATAPALAFSALLFFLVASAHGAERTRESFNRDWRFTRDDPVGLTMALDYAAARRWLQPMGGRNCSTAPTMQLHGQRKIRGRRELSRFLFRRQRLAHR